MDRTYLHATALRFKVGDRIVQVVQTTRRFSRVDSPSPCFNVPSPDLHLASLVGGRHARWCSRPRSATFSSLRTCR
jgi:hypothetical protein